MKNQKTATKSATKIVVILATYIFRNVNRICFKVLSSDGVTKYQTCFTNGKGSCTCDGNAIWHKECCHIKFLTPIAAEKLEKRKAVAEAEAIVSKPVDEEYEAWKRDNGLTVMNRNEYCATFAIYE